jgi:hypothetical protein
MIGYCRFLDWEMPTHKKGVDDIANIQDSP